MTLQEMIALFYQCDPDNPEFEFDRIQNPRSRRRDLCAFTMIDSVVPGNWRIIAAAEHDEIWIDVDVAFLARCVNKDFIIDLIRCGVEYDESNQLFRMLV